MIYDYSVKSTSYCLESGSSFGAHLPEKHQLRRGPFWTAGNHDHV